MAIPILFTPKYPLGVWEGEGFEDLEKIFLQQSKATKKLCAAG